MQTNITRAQKQLIHASDIGHDGQQDDTTPMVWSVDHPTAATLETADTDRSIWVVGQGPGLANVVATCGTAVAAIQVVVADTPDQSAITLTVDPPVSKF